ncbi:hypothetical protein PHYPSEUDO_014197 [Phytophthora pseudosyringae]|uniref:EGF-like domain-containing protein n=1 Tax=Phytophthora pseudosyringae TaxID=221518 RepID=A0A8T1V4G5_9STRA|nr:hypothetical protein PHYPSEUDO_014197 [Phytophthora pseudosyringae]
MRSLLLAASAALLLGAGATDAACARGVYNNKICSGHGACNARNLCECDARHLGFDCSQERCPLGPAWVAPARATDDAHYLVECSNKGVCDHEEGKCTCDEGFAGSACHRLECDSGCNSAGQCLSLKELSATFAVGAEPLYETAWDADMIYGCKCRKGYHGYDCSLKSCPKGDDPLTTGQKNEVQIVQCTGTGGSFRVFFNGQDAEVPFDATLEDLEKILVTIKTLPVVEVTFGGTAKTVCSSTTANAIMIEFIQDFGPQPPIKVLGTLKGVVYLKGGSVFATSAGGILAGRTSVQGTKEWEFCSNRGDCKFDTGQCICFINPMPGYRSSDGYGNPGTRGDCGCANDKNLYDQVDEIQLLSCIATGGVFRLQYRTSTSIDIPFDVTSDTLRDILMTSFGFEDPVVEYSFGTKACSAPATTANIIIITFPIDHGDIPPLRAVTTGLTSSSGPVSLTTADNAVAIGGVVSQKGTKENVVCSNKGYCNYNQGTCSCSLGYGTSDGRGNEGNRDDCGRILPKVKNIAQN